MNTEKELLDLISQRTGYEADKIQPRMDFEHDLNISRAELIEFVSSVEDRFNISFADEQLDRIKSVGDLTNLVLDHLGVIN
jgi:acyl carrier protein